MQFIDSPAPYMANISLKLIFIGQYFTEVDFLIELMIY